jgi:hypothetical protein
MQFVVLSFLFNVKFMAGKFSLGQDVYNSFCSQYLYICHEWLVEQNHKRPQHEGLNLSQPH